MSPLLEDVSNKKGTIALCLGLLMALNMLLHRFDCYLLSGLDRFAVTLFAVLVLVVDHKDGLSRSNIFFLVAGMVYCPILGMHFQGDIGDILYPIFALAFFWFFFKSRSKQKPVASPDQQEESKANSTPTTVNETDFRC